MTPKYLTIHCSATPATADWGVKEIRRIHVGQNGWSDVGYHLIIKRDGTVENGRPMTRMGAHVKGHNRDNIGVCLIGGVDANGKGENNFTPAQLCKLQSVIFGLCAQYKIPLDNVKGHRDWFPDHNGDGIIDSRDWLKVCPSFDVRAWLASREWD